MFFVGYIIFCLLTVADAICTAILVNLVPDAYYLPVAALCAVFVTGIFTIATNSSLTALSGDDLYDDWLFVPIVRWVVSYIPVIGAIAFGIQEGKIFADGYISANTSEFAVFAVIAFLLCSAIFAGHFLLCKKICDAICAYEERTNAKAMARRNKIVYTSSSGSSNDDGDTRTELEKQNDKELEEFHNIVESQ